MAKKRFNSVRQSIDVIDRESGVVLCHFYYCPLVSGDYECARDLAIYFVRERCRRHDFQLSWYQFVDHYHGSCWSLIL